VCILLNAQRIVSACMASHVVNLFPTSPRFFFSFFLTLKKLAGHLPPNLPPPLFLVKFVHIYSLKIICFLKIIRFELIILLSYFLSHPFLVSVFFLKKFLILFSFHAFPVIIISVTVSHFSPN
jgi:hypothetical protein